MGRGWKALVAAVVIAGTMAMAQPASAAVSPVFLGEFFNQPAPKTGDQLAVLLFARDPDGGDITGGSYKWLLDGVEIPGATGSLVPRHVEGDIEFDNVFEMEATLSLGVAGNGDKGDELSLEYTINDGVDPALVGETSSVTVVNTPPRLKSTVTPLLPGSNATLSVATNSFDADGDTLTFTHRWTRNAKLIAGATADELDLSVPGHGDAGDQIAARVKVSDGVDSRTIRSNVVGVASPVGYGVGQIYPDFTLRNQRGEQVSLSDFKGDHVLLVLSTLWCAPSGAMSPPVPLIQEILGNYDGLPGFTYLQVELEDRDQNLTDQTDATAFATKYGVPGHVLHQNGGNSDVTWDIDFVGATIEQPGAFPTLVFINPKGKVTRVHQGALFATDILDHYDEDLPDFADLKSSPYDLGIQSVGMTLRMGTSSGHMDQALTPDTDSLHPLTGMPGRTGGVVSSLVGDTETWNVVVDTDGSHDISRTKPIKLVLGARSITVPVSRASNGNVTVGPVTLADKGFASGDPIRALSTNLRFDHLPGLP